MCNTQSPVSGSRIYFHLVINRVCYTDKKLLTMLKKRNYCTIYYNYVDCFNALRVISRFQRVWCIFCTIVFLFQYISRYLFSCLLFSGLLRWLATALHKSIQFWEDPLRIAPLKIIFRVKSFDQFPEETIA